MISILLVDVNDLLSYDFQGIFVSVKYSCVWVLSPLEYLLLLPPWPLDSLQRVLIDWECLHASQPLCVLISRKLRLTFLRINSTEASKIHTTILLQEWPVVIYHTLQLPQCHTATDTPSYRCWAGVGSDGHVLLSTARNDWGQLVNVLTFGTEASQYSFYSKRSYCWT